MSEQSIRLGVREIIHNAIVTHFIRKDGTEISAFHTQRSHDVAELVERRIASFVSEETAKRDAKAEQDKAYQEMAAEQPMAGPDSSGIRPMTATEADPRIIRSGDEVAIMWPGENKPMKGTIHHIGGIGRDRETQRMITLNEVVCWAQSAPANIFQALPMRVNTKYGDVELFESPTNGKVYGGFV